MKSIMASVLSGKRVVVKDVKRARVGATCRGLSRERQGQSFPVITHPAGLAGRNTDHQYVCRHVTVHHRPRANKSAGSNGAATDDGAVGAQRGAAFDPRRSIFALALHLGTRVVDIGEDDTGATEDIFF